MLELGLFRHEKKGEDRIITHISDKENWQVVKETLLKNVGLAAAPVIRIVDANFKGQQALYLLHEYDGRELEISYAQCTLMHLYTLWQRKVVLQSRMADKPVFMIFDGTGSVKTSGNLF